MSFAKCSNVWRNAFNYLSGSYVYINTHNLYFFKFVCILVNLFGLVNGMPNLLSALPVEIFSCVPASMSGLTLKAIGACLLRLTAILLIVSIQTHFQY